MDDDDFEDLLEDIEMLRDASLVSLTGVAANPPAIDEDIDSQSSSLGTFPPQISPAVDIPGNKLLAVQTRCAAFMHQIESVFEGFTDDLLKEKSVISITLKSRNVRAQPVTPNSNTASPSKHISFPGKTADEAWRFAVVMRIMEVMHEALRTDMTVSKRDIYYQDPALFGSQAIVDRYVDDIAFTFGVSRSALNVTAAAKGLVAGAISLCRKGGSNIVTATDREGILVPHINDLLPIDMKFVKWILVIEKEATFRSIAASSFWESASQQGLLLTAKGYPDLASRAFLHHLSMPSVDNSFASPPVFALVDFDPDGLAIAMTYKLGSKALAHETDKHCVPQLQLIGLHSDDLHHAAMDSTAAQELLPLTARDRKKAVHMLEQFVDHADDNAVLVKPELQVMLMLNMKAELQLFDAVPNGMTDFLTSKLPK